MSAPSNKSNNSFNNLAQPFQLLRFSFQQRRAVPEATKSRSNGSSRPSREAVDEDARSRTAAAGLYCCWGPIGIQNEIDILRYSYQEALGSTRTMAMGGAFGALGADLASLNSNPAGIGMYRRGDAGLTTGFASKKSKININGQIGNANQLAGSTTNLGIALSYPSVNPDWP